MEVAKKKLKADLVPVASVLYNVLSTRIACCLC